MIGTAKTSWWPRTLRWRVYSLVGALLLLVLATAGAAIGTRLYLASISTTLDGSLRPAQASVTSLAKGYVDMETGQRGFLLTHDDRFLQPYDAGRAEVDTARGDLRRLLTSDPTAIGLLRAVDAAGGAWLQGSAEPEIAGARAGTLTGSALAASIATGKQRFDTLRVRVTDLQNRIVDRVIVAQHSADDAQSALALTTVACAVLAVIIGLGTLLLMRHSLLAPVNRLLGHVRRIADGELDQPVAAGGPTELAELAQAVEAMRERIRTEVDRAADSASQLARLAESDRIAEEVGARVIARMFAASLAAQSAAGRFPAARAALTAVTADIDGATDELRLALYGQRTLPRREPLGARVVGLVSELEPTLGEAPELRLSGDVDEATSNQVADDLLQALRETLVAVRAAATDRPTVIDVSVVDARLRLRVAGPTGAAPSDVRDILSRLARRHQGDSTAARDADRLVVDWWVPLRPGAARDA